MNLLPLIGCYITKGIKQESETLGELASSILEKTASAQIWYLEESLPGLAKSASPKSASLSRRLVDFALQPSRLTAPFPDRPRADIHIFAFRESDCGEVDTLMPILSPCVVAMPPSGRDFNETYKMLKGFNGIMRHSRCLLKFVPEPSLAIAEQLTEAFNKLTDRFLHTKVSLLRANDKDRGGLGDLRESDRQDMLKRQIEFVLRVEKGLGNGESIS